MLLLLLLSACDQSTWCERFNLACDLDGEVERPEFVDEDGDIWTSDVDCDDLDPEIHPSAEEVCDGYDNDCDLEIDEGTPGMRTWYYDEDLDDYGVSTNTLVMCDRPPSYTLEPGDCDDRRPSVNPGQTERCNNGIDDDCDGTANHCGLGAELSGADADRWLFEAHDGADLGLAVAVSGPTLETRVAAFGDPGWEGHGGVWGIPAPTLNQSAAPASVDSFPYYMNTTQEGAELGASLAAVQTGGGLWALAAGAPGASFDAEGEGAVVVSSSYSPRLRELDQGSALIVGGDADRRLGATIVAIGDADGDEIGDLLVGAPGDQDGAGAVAVLLPPLGGHSELGDAALWLRDGPADAALGRVLAGGDLDGDGLAELVMGSPDEGAGTVRVAFSPHPWGMVSADDVDVVVVGAEVGDQLGAAVIVAGDLDGDGIDDLALGAPGTSEDAGATFLFRGGQTMWSRAGRLQTTAAEARLEGAAAGDRAGTALAGQADLDGDDEPDLLIGAPELWEDEGKGTVGAVYIITSQPLGTLDLSVAGSVVFGSVGSGVGGMDTVHLLEDIDNNGIDELVIGAPGLAQSAVWVFTPLGL